MGSEQHMKTVFESLRWSRVFKSKQDRVKLGRWASWFNANRSWRGEKMPLLLVLMYMGMQKGWFKSIWDLPIFSSRHMELPEDPDLDPDASEVAPAPTAPSASSSSASTAPVAKKARTASSAASSSSAPASSAASSSAAPASSTSAARCSASAASSSSAGEPLAVAHDGRQTAGGIDKAPDTVKESNKELKKVRGESANTLHFVAKVLANNYGNQVCECIDVAAFPSCEFFDEGKTRCKTVAGKRAWQEWVANRGYQDIMRRTMAVFHDPGVMKVIGFVPGMQYKQVTAPLAEQDGNLAKLLLKLVLAESYAFLLSTMTW